MKVFLDTNVIIDYFDSQREHYFPATILFDLAQRGKLELVVCAQSFITAFYVLKNTIRKKCYIKACIPCTSYVEFRPLTLQSLSMLLHLKALISKTRYNTFRPPLPKPMFLLRVISRALMNSLALTTQLSNSLIRFFKIIIPIHCLAKSKLVHKLNQIF